MNKKLEKELGRVNEELARSEKHIKEAQEHHKTLLEKKTQIENDIIIDRIRDMQGKGESVMDILKTVTGMQKENQTSHYRFEEDEIDEKEMD